MKELYFKAELLDDIVLSQRTATAGDHKSLDYIPGTTILGSLAGKFYSSFGSDKAWDIFNSSKVCFCNAYPMLNEKRSIPMPLSFHSEKVPSKGKENEILNFVCTKGTEGIQYRQNRTGFIGFSGEKINLYSVDKTSRMRTAIEAKTGSAAKSQLYGYESINAGQIFVGKILFDEEIENTEEFEKIKKVFENGDILHIGRSRTASYGRVKVSKLENQSSENQKASGNSFSILAVSDLCLRNLRTGKAELQLLPEVLGLSSDWKIDCERSFTRPNTIYQYNGHRRELEIQKTLISKGSVFTFKSNRDLTSEEITSISEKLISGIGTSRGQGYGEISLLDAKNKYTKVTDEVEVKIEENEKNKLSDEDREWLEWLATYSYSDDVEKLVMPMINEFLELCKHIKSYNKISGEKKFWPSSTQWSNVRNVASNYGDRKSIVSHLFEGENPVIKKFKTEYTEKNNDTKTKKPDEEWNYEDSKGMTLRTWLMEVINKIEEKNIQNVLVELCKRCSVIVNNPKWFEEAK